MSLGKGTRLGQYEVHELIGVGGMGEVYRGYDTQLKRDVALKVLPERFSRDSERLARFRREATVLASLNHPNIAAIHRLEQSGDTVALVMEYVPGETLADRLRREASQSEPRQSWSGPAASESYTSGLPLEESLDIARQICDALDHAHEKNIIHRDLKPANVKVTPEGRVKVLDFGLAKAFLAEPDSTPLDSQSPTLPLRIAPTIPGVILGTPSYMSPEQARGKAVDKRTDIFALGCVLYELLTGKQAFTGESLTDILGAVMRAEPDWTELPEATPPAIRALLRRCLQKDAAKRSRDAAEIRIQIEEAGAASSSIATPVVVHAPAPAPRRWQMYAAVACIAAVIAGIAVWQLRPAPAAFARPVERLAIPLPANTTLLPRAMESVVVSPNGSNVAYIGGRSGGTPQIFLRAMDALEATPIAGTEGADSPFFSPDGQWIGFFSGQALKKISISGGAALTLGIFAGPPTGATWGPNDTIVFSPTNLSGLVRVSAAGGQPQLLTALLPGEFSHRWPQFLPDGKTLLFTVGVSQNYDDAQIAVQRLDSNEHKILLRGGTHARYATTGHLVYHHAGTLMAVPFDQQTLEVMGSPAPIVEGVLASTGGTAQFSVSNFGTLAYIPGTSQSVNVTMVWVDRRGASQPLPAPPHPYRPPRISPDGRLIAVGIGSDVWIYDIARDTLTRLTFERNNAATAAYWTADGKRIVFPSDRAGPTNLFWKPVDGSGPEERLTTSQNVQRASFSSPDGRFLVFTEIDPKTGSDLWVLPLDGDRKPRIFLQTPFEEGAGQFSPDGHWIAYVSNESGRNEVYVRPFPGPGGKWQVSTDGGSENAWSPKGNELFYRTGGQREKMMAVDFQTQPTFAAGKPRLLFEGNYGSNAPLAPGAFYSVSPDGQRFLMTKSPDQPQAALTQINVVLNWFEELKSKVPVK